MRQCSKKVLLLTKYSWRGPSSRYRFYQFLPYLNGEQLTCEVSPLLDDAYLASKYTKQKPSIIRLFMAYIKRLVKLSKVKHYDLIFVEKEILPYCFALPERYLSWVKIPYVVDYDDAQFHRYDISTNKLVYYLFKNKIATVMNLANAVVVGNQYLADYAKQAQAKIIHEVPTVIDLEKYPEEPKYVTHSQQDNVLTVGWIGSPGSIDFLLAFTDMFKEICASGDIKLKLVGSGDVEMPGVPVEIIPWSEETEVDDILTFDVGIMPLPDWPWTRGKCGFKLIQYMTCYLPVIASPVGVNSVIVDHGVNGYLASTQQEWFEALNDLKNDPQKRNDFGFSGRKKIEQNYSLQAIGPHLAHIMSSYIKS